ncbi:MAG: HD domain-containing protein [Solirubrobacteraceae bacterium]
MGRSRHVPFAGSGLHQTLAALAYAVEQHAGQRRAGDGAPFVLHPIEVATLLADAGAPDHVVAAGVLHDTIEKTTTEAEDLRGRFGARVASIVVALSEDPSISGYSARKAALREQVRAASDEALMVFAADKLSTARELRLAFDRDPRDGRARHPAPRGSKAHRKLMHYRHCEEMLEERLADSPLVEGLRRELAELALAGRPQFAGAR